MNTLRTTERKLTMLAFGKFACAPQKAKRGIKTTRTLGDISRSKSSRNPLKELKSNGKSSARGTPMIKFIQDLQVRQLSTVKLEIPFLNPNKPGPKELKDLTTQPIVPLTMSSFPKTDLKVPSVTKILGATMPASSRYVLDRWKATMIEKLGTEGFAQYQKDTFERGRVLHALLANYLLGHGEPTEGIAELSKDINVNLWKSIQNVVKANISNVRLVEHIVTHRGMNYRGIVDCVAFYKDELVVIDFKTAEKPKKNVDSLYDNPIQVSAYCAAINNDCNIPTSVIDRNICSGVVIVAYVDGSEASTYYLNQNQITNTYWKQWETRLQQYSKLEEMQRSAKKLAA